MENTYQKGQSNGSAVNIKMPKNIRQVGSVLYHGRVIYVEDYVMTFVKQLADIDPGELRVAVFLGYSVKTEEAKNIFIKGAVEMRNVDFGTSMTLTDDGWTSVYENIKKYFTDVEIVGWALIGPGFYLESNDKIRKIHSDNFSGSDKALLKMDSMEREEAFYFCENSQLIKQPGYYLYYEKNEEMQNYMVEYKEEKIVREEAVYNDQTTKRIRSVIQDKKEVKDDRSVVRLLYAASSLLAIIVLVIAATMLDSYDKMKKMESALSTISQNLNVAGDNKDQDVASDGTTDKSGKNPVNQADANKEDDVKEAENGTGGDSQAVPVDKVEGNVTPEPQTTKQAEAEVSEEPTKAAESTPEPTKAAETPKDTKDTKPASATVKYYTVKAGDSLASISYKLYKTYTYMDEIKKLNKIEDENKILVGQKLRVP
ncbi:LysM peptidoglycan-binding domain-containing protein [Anaerocolumna xylanovorans]|uniref:LysM domain-containing protein n=1 Tax=Anaerocolumna xylanovorans DSM 12503 TaxID=1121345 RepID=A0A1M7YMI0_9FIRM|nr:LysM peptidoglycan-binding domain-containing protein [Anaerocolumna xylanovorans]SHO53792.1 LysM domain-containing protein [Anaerocolumna xylanovorans DSM 12503]